MINLLKEFSERNINPSDVLNQYESKDNLFFRLVHYFFNEWFLFLTSNEYSYNF